MTTPCPKCGSSPVGIPRAACPACGYGEHPAPTRDRASPPDTNLPGWVHLEDTGIAEALWDTVRKTILTPVKTFASLGQGADPFRAWLFAMLTGSIGMAVSVLVNMATGWGTDSDGGSMLPSIGSSAALIVAPLALSLEVALWSLYGHTMLVLTGKRSARFASTFVAACYSGTASLFLLVPGAGRVLASVVYLYLFSTGLACLHGTNRVRVLLILLLPAVVSVIFLAFWGIMAAGAGVLLREVLKDMPANFR